MTGENNLQALLKNMSPTLNEGKYVFCTVGEPISIDRSLILLEFKEKKGTTVVLEQSSADKLGLTYEYVSAWITLEVNSSLAAVGLTAAVSSALATASISCNVVAAYYHDHLFVDYDDRERAIRILSELSARHPLQD